MARIALGADLGDVRFQEDLSSLSPDKVPRREALSVAGSERLSLIIQI